MLLYYNILIYISDKLNRWFLSYRPVGLKNDVFVVFWRVDNRHNYLIINNLQITKLLVQCKMYTMSIGIQNILNL
jgi:hypothetical protein